MGVVIHYETSHPRSNGRASREFKSRSCGSRYAFCKLDWRFSVFLYPLFTPSLSPRTPPELFFLVAKFLESSPCQEAAQVMQNWHEKTVQKALHSCCEVAPWAQCHKLHFLSIFTGLEEGAVRPQGLYLQKYVSTTLQRVLDMREATVSSFLASCASL